MQNLESKLIRQIAYDKTMGVIRALTHQAFWLIVAYLAFLGIGDMLMPVDDCNQDMWHRCEMTVLTDHLTGKQYLETTGGGITPRLK